MRFSASKIFLFLNFFLGMRLIFNFFGSHQDSGWLVYNGDALLVLKLLNMDPPCVNIMVYPFTLNENTALSCCRSDTLLLTAAGVFVS